MIYQKQEEINFFDTIELFINYVMPRIDYQNSIPKFNILFNNDSLAFLNDFSKHTGNEITLKNIQKLMKQDPKKATMVIKNHYDFFWNMTELSTTFIQNYNKQDVKDFQFLQLDLLQKIWLRMVPSDFNNVESFLRKQINFLQDKTFDSYLNFTTIDYFYNYEIQIKQELGELWDENFKILHLRMVSQNEIHDLPMIHYDIEDNICYIGSVQREKEGRKSKKIERLLYKLNANVLANESKEYHDYKKGLSTYYPENISDLHPSFILSLMVFFEMLENVGIKYIKVPALHVLSYDYHKLLSYSSKRDFESTYGSYVQAKDKTLEDFHNNLWNYEIYLEDKKRYEHFADREDFISKNKTENLFRLFRRVQYHFPSIKIKTIPMMESDYLEIEIDKVKVKKIREK